MTTDRTAEWQKFWEDKGGNTVSDFEYDRGRSPRADELEELSNAELLSFINPQPTDVVFDAGCGTGVNVLLLHAKVARIIAMDYNAGAVERTRRRASNAGLSNVEMFHGSITNTPLLEGSVDKVLCMSVLQYLDDDGVRAAFREFRRILRPGGAVILHVKNFASLYLSTLWLMKKLKALLGRSVRLEYYRTSRWYMDELSAVGLGVTNFNSFNLFVLDRMPHALLQRVQRFELMNYNGWLLRRSFVRRHGADLKIRAELV
jgi:ubiquinone/menaquinone biosynthesis C-methylase UbiE